MDIYVDKCWIQMDRNIEIQKDRSDCRLKERYKSIAGIGAG